MRALPVAAVLLAAATVFSAESPRPATLKLPGGEAGVRLDDFYFDTGIGRLVVPAGRTGKVFVIDPAADSIEAVEGFAAPAASTGIVGGGPTSAAAAGDGTILVTDRTDRALYVIDAVGRRVLAKAALGDSPDYVRYVAPTGEAWVTEPHKDRIEVFSLSAGSAPSHAAFIDSTRGEYEALAIDAERGRAYSNQETVTSVIDLKTRAVVAAWRNGCKSAEGLALDAKRGWLLVACREGRVAVLDVAHDGKTLSSVKAGQGVDIIAYAPERSRVYIPGSSSATLAVAELSGRGKLRVLRTAPGVAGGHCAAADPTGVWVCDPRAGALIHYPD